MNKVFRKSAARFPKEQGERQGRAARLAWEAFSQPGAALAFLNAFDSELGGRPIDLATASAEGLLCVEQAIAARAASPAG